MVSSREDDVLGGEEGSKGDSEVGGGITRRLLNVALGYLCLSFATRRRPRSAPVNQPQTRPPPPPPPLPSPIPLPVIDTYPLITYSASSETIHIEQDYSSVHCTQRQLHLAL